MLRKGKDATVSVFIFHFCNLFALHKQIILHNTYPDNLVDMLLLVVTKLILAPVHLCWNSWTLNMTQISNYVHIAAIATQWQSMHWKKHESGTCSVLTLIFRLPIYDTRSPLTSIQITTGSVQIRVVVGQMINASIIFTPMVKKRYNWVEQKGEEQEENEELLEADTESRSWRGWGWSHQADRVITTFLRLHRGRCPEHYWAEERTWGHVSSADITASMSQLWTKIDTPSILVPERHPTDS